MAEDQHRALALQTQTIKAGKHDRRNGAVIWLRSSNPEPRLSGVGHEATMPQVLLCQLPPAADMPLVRSWSGLCQKPTLPASQTAPPGTCICRPHADLGVALSAGRPPCASPLDQRRRIISAVRHAFRRPVEAERQAILRSFWRRQPVAIRRIGRLLVGEIERERAVRAV
jgi:hypothetical protein